jgi:AraC-like DNA-binding protein
MNMKNLGNRCFIHLLRPTFRVLEMKGYRTEQFLNGTGLSRADVQNIYTVISRDQEMTIYQNIVELVDEPDVGLEVGYLTNLLDIGPVGHAISAARNMREASVLLTRFSHTVMTLFRWSASIEGEYVVARLDTTVLMEEEVKRYASDLAISTMINRLSDIVGQSVVPDRVCVNYSSGGYDSRYLEYIGRVPEFNCENTFVVYPSSLFDRTLLIYDPEVKDSAERLCLSLEFRLNIDENLCDHVKVIIKRRPGFWPDVNYVAEKLEISTRILRRRLQDNGTNYQTLLNTARQEVAEHLLETTHCSMQDIADLCGFSAVKNFSSAFKRWTGMSPTQYRSSLRS